MLDAYLEYMTKVNLSHKVVILTYVLLLKNEKMVRKIFTNFESENFITSLIESEIVFLKKNVKFYDAFD